MIHKLVIAFGAIVNTMPLDHVEPIISEEETEMSSIYSKLQELIDEVRDMRESIPSMVEESLNDRDLKERELFRDSCTSVPNHKVSRRIYQDSEG